MDWAQGRQGNKGSKKYSYTTACNEDMSFGLVGPTLPLPTYIAFITSHASQDYSHQMDFTLEFSWNLAKLILT
jgi:hypothetical protein